MEVNEEIIEQYLKFVKHWFYISDISFRVPGNFSNIDLLAFDPASGDYYDIEVKYRSVVALTARNRSGRNVARSSMHKLVSQFTSKHRKTTVSQYTNGAAAKKI